MLRAREQMLRLLTGVGCARLSQPAASGFRPTPHARIWQCESLVWVAGELFCRSPTTIRAPLAVSCCIVRVLFIAGAALGLPPGEVRIEFDDRGAFLDPVSILFTDDCQHLGLAMPEGG